MQKITVLVTLLFASAPAFAHPGGHSVICKSASKSGSKQVVEFKLSRANGTGWAPPSFSVSVNGKKTEFNTEDGNKTFGETFHNSPLGVITITADNHDEENAAAHGHFSLIAVPSTVKAYDSNGKSVKWSFKAEKDECNDSNGKATFQGLFRGWTNTTGDTTSDGSVDLQIMDCVLEYNSGMAC